ncbi:HK97-gp10 family putative phage morphogenesis protein [Macrococcoides caseolyticum]|uniref:HK97-gp10 family putative phage morphogenesis protein n=1 Tax=Macrococcoides caseolyticum TaxID=69966 RepID=UPI001F33F3DA|nr:HK97-gp10 family putative phage morphogenesis protein [Macrococcus caseolyticus]MCE4957257.1 HK97 gp10 family phage protein [Macrococcus caseolyticus]
MSNKSGVEVNGVDAIISKLESLNVNVKKVKSNALKSAGEIVRKELEKNTPISDEDDIHMKEHVVMSNMKTENKTGGSYVAIGYPKGVKHRVHVVEFGTINQSPQAFMSKTIKDVQSDVRKEILKQLKGAIK